jgi:hypothetical protein
VAFAIPASARVFVAFGFPLFYPPPIYYPPPSYYPPPPVYYAPPPQAYYVPPRIPGAAGQSCIVNGAALCPMERPTASGNTCWCSTSNGRVYGQAR